MERAPITIKFMLACHRSTARGKAWVQYIVNTPLPVATWSLPERPEAAVIEGEYSET